MTAAEKAEIIGDAAEEAASELVEERRQHPVEPRPLSVTPAHVRRTVATVRGW
ncbi:hypothetical protein [Streptantibioticus silvisoli]|uniref:Uncharacterized protein n=1 Tax=Streptantibioticus silvisoli TaxID=2705255 RepID=A0ABT6W4U7_9ACTN|nr:hypothetical protein [Streptantibioticus silvisoli]MDI5965765.1 hypothetical protein [Streptantibioticus silvisoli]